MTPSLPRHRSLGRGLAPLLGVIGVSVVLLGCLPRTALAQWSASGVPVRIEAGNCDGAVMLADGSAGAFIAWMDARNGLVWDIYVQHLLADGTTAPGWPVNGARACTGPGNQTDCRLALDGSGGVFVVWSDQRHAAADIYAQHLTSGGVPSSGWLAGGVSVCSAAGGAFIAWSDQRDGTDFRTYVQHLLGSGAAAAGWPADGQGASTVAALQFARGMVSDGQGGAIVVWEDNRSGVDLDLYAQRFAAGGPVAPGWPEGGAPIVTAPGDQFAPAVVADDDGGVIVVWEDAQRDEGDIFGQRITGDGVIAAGWPDSGVAVCVAEAEQARPIVISDGSAGAIAAWADNRGRATNVYARRVDSDGGVAPGWPANGLRVSDLSTTQVMYPSLCPDGQGGALVAWDELVDVFERWEDVFAQHLTATGALVSGWPEGGLDAYPGPYTQVSPTIVPDGFGGVIVQWVDARRDIAGTNDLYVARISADGVVPVRISLASTEVTPNRVDLSWYTPDLVPRDYRVYRRDHGGSWGFVGTPDRRTAGRLAYSDTAVLPGETYGYRLGWREGDNEFFGAEVTLTVPSIPRLVIAGVGPNPAHAEIELRVILPSQRPARVDFMDVAGATKWSTVYAGAKAGEQLIRLRLQDSLPGPGVYFVKVSQGGQSAVRKIAVLR